MNYSEYQALLYKQQAEAQRQANEARAAEQRARQQQTTIQKERERDIGERMYGKLMRDVRESVKPMYPSLWRKKAVKYHTREQKSKIEEQQAKREKEWYQREGRKYASQLKSLKEDRAQWKEVERAGESEARVHPGGWVKITKSGVSSMGIAAMSPAQAKSLGYEWGTYSYKQNRVVSLPGRPTESEYLGILKEKKRRGQYKGKSLTDITKTIEVGKAKYGVKAPPWAGADKKEFEKYDKTAREIKQAYLKTAEKLKAQEFQAPVTHKVTPKKAEEYKKAKQDIFGIRTAAVVKHEKGLEHFKGLGTKRERIEQQVKGQEELIARTEAKAKEYAKGGWTPAEALSYTTFARQTELMGKDVSKKIEKFGKEITGAGKRYKKETGLDIGKPTPEIKKYETQVETFFGKYPEPKQRAFEAFISRKDIERAREVEKVVAPSPKKKMPVVTLGAAGRAIRDTGEMPTVSIDITKRKPTPAAIARAVTVIPERQRDTIGVMKEFVTKGLQRFEREEHETWKEFKKTPVPKVMLGVTETGEHIIGKIHISAEEAKKIISKFPTIKTSEVVAERYSKPTFGVSTWITPTAPFEFVSAVTAPRESKEVHPLKDIKKGEELWAKHVVTPISLELGGERAKAIAEQRERKVPTNDLPKPEPVRQVIRGAGEMVAGIPAFVAFTAPRVIAESTIKPTAIPKKAVGFGTGMVGFAAEEPFRFAGGIAAMLAIPAARKLPAKPGISVARLPKAQAVSVGFKLVKSPGILKKGGYGEFYPIITVGKGGLKRVSIGKPKIKGEIFSKELYAPKTPFETRIAVEAIPKEALKITEARGVRYYTIKSGVKPKELRPIIRETLEHHGLKKSTDVVTTLLKKEKADLYGSMVQKAAARRVGEPGLMRTPRDFDVKVTNTELFARRAIREINKAEGREAVVLRGKEVVVKKSGEKLFDIHPKKEPIPPKEYLGGEDYLAYGLKEEPKIKTVERIRTTTLSEQATRKLHGAMRITEEPRELISEAGVRVHGRIIPAHKGRIKDIADYYFAEKANIAGLKAKGKVVSAKKADIHLENWLKTWGNDVKVYTKNLYTDTIRREGGTKAWLGSFEKKPISPSQSYKVVSQIKYIPSVSVVPSTIPSSYISSTFGISEIPSEISTISDIKVSKMPSKISRIDSKIVSESVIRKSKIPSKPSFIPFEVYPTPFITKAPKIEPISKISKAPSKVSKFLYPFISRTPKPVSKIPSKPPRFPRLSIVPSIIKPSEVVSKPSEVPYQYPSVISSIPISTPPFIEKPKKLPIPKKKKKVRKIRKRKFEEDFYHFPEITRIKTPEQLLGFFR